MKKSSYVMAGMRMGKPGWFAALAITALAAGCSSAHGKHLSSNLAIVRPQVTSTVEHWGSFFGNTPGNVDTLKKPVPVTLPGRIAEIGSSNSTEYALMTDGRLYAWGLGSQGELGNGGLANSLNTPVRVRFPAGVRIASIPTDVMPFDTGLAVDTKGHAWGWGDNAGGSLCLGNTRIHATPAELPLPHVTALAGASTHAIYDAGGTVYACGGNLAGDLGDGGKQSSTRPVKVVGLAGKTVVKLVASFANSGALLTNGEFLDWGYNGAGQLGDGHMGGSSDVPVRAHLGSRVRQAAEGGSIWNNGQTVVLLSDGSTWAWGNDHAGQLGNGTAGKRAKPVRIAPPAGVTYTRLATGSATAYAISSTGAVYAWGVSHEGQLGDGSTDTSFKPVLIARDATAISATANNAVIEIK